MTKTEIIDAYTLPGESKNQAIERVADALRIQASAVYQWPDRLAGPRLYAIQCVLEKLSNNRLKADPRDHVSNDEAKQLRATGHAVQSPVRPAEPAACAAT